MLFLSGFPSSKIFSCARYNKKSCKSSCEWTGSWWNLLFEVACVVRAWCTQAAAEIVTLRGARDVFKKLT